MGFWDAVKKALTPQPPPLTPQQKILAEANTLLLAIEQELAYPIRTPDEGTYRMMRLKDAKTQIALLRQQVTLTERGIRSVGITDRAQMKVDPTYRFVYGRGVAKQIRANTREKRRAEDQAKIATWEAVIQHLDYLTLTLDRYRTETQRQIMELKGR